MPALWGAALPIAVYFLVRHRVHTDAQALIIAGGFSGAWVLSQFMRQRKVDLVGMAVLIGFALGFVSSTLLGGNTYVLKIRDASITGPRCTRRPHPSLKQAYHYLRCKTQLKNYSATCRYQIDNH